MQKTIIIGPQGSGKSTLANKITNGRKSIVVRYENKMNENRYWAAGVESDTEVIFIGNDEKEVINDLLAELEKELEQL